MAITPKYIDLPAAVTRVTPPVVNPIAGPTPGWITVPDTRFLTRILLVLVPILVALDLIGIVTAPHAIESECSQIFCYTRPVDAPVLGSLATVVRLLTFAIGLAWVGTTVRAADRLTGVRGSVSIAVCSWLVPFANAVLPFVSTRRAWLSLRAGARTTFWLWAIAFGAHLFVAQSRWVWMDQLGNSLEHTVMRTAEHPFEPIRMALPQTFGWLGWFDAALLLAAGAMFVRVAVQLQVAQNTTGTPLAGRADVATRK